MPTPGRRRNDRERPNRAADKSATVTGTDPTQDDIARRAYELYEQRGRAPGQAWDDWLLAERELRRQRAT